MASWPNDIYFCMIGCVLVVGSGGGRCVIGRNYLPPPTLRLSKIEGHWGLFFSSVLCIISLFMAIFAQKFLTR